MSDSHHVYTPGGPSGADFCAHTPRLICRGVRIPYIGVCCVVFVDKVMTESESGLFGDLTRVGLSKLFMRSNEGIS